MNAENAERFRLGSVAQRWLLPAVVFLGVGALWEGVSRSGAVPEYLLPSPSAVLLRAVELRSSLGGDLLTTALESFLGFLLGSGLGIALGVWFAKSRVAERSLMPYAIALKAVPIVAVAPLLVIWFGYGLMTKVLVASLISFFPCVVSTTQGLRDVDTRALDLMYSVAATDWQVFRWLRWPGALEHVFSALRIAVVFSVIGAVVAEFAGANEGLGFRILVASYRIDTVTMFVYIGLTAVLGMVLFGGVVLLERLAVPWSAALRSGAFLEREE